ncbi:MAG: hypothetical protein LAO09_07070 [Acidobacteriia bacterium]|nr:hypothetical protein [Terriglobia bacterium]
MRAPNPQTFNRSRPTDPVRFRGHRGGVIAMHRALTHFRLGPMNVLTSVSLFLFFSWVWVAFLPWVCRLWSSAFAFALQNLPLDARLDTAEHGTHLFHLEIPYLRVEPVLPTLTTWSLTCAVTLLLFAASFFLPKRLVPLVYLLRAVLLVQASALIFFALFPTRFPHTPDGYLEALVTSGAGLISVVPLLFGFTYYIFDFGLLRKALLTALTMTHLSLFLPFQVLLQALVLQKTVLFMPLLYIVFGMPLDVMLIIAVYSWGMTWSFRPAPLANR